MIIEVEFKGNRREFFLWESDEIPARNTPVIVEADRGEDLGRVRSTGEDARHRNKGTPHGTGQAGPTRKARRLATRDDVRRHDDLSSQNEAARGKAMDRVKANALVMKISDAEWQWDRKKLTFYFTAEKRVDFRTLVRELAAAFRTRIELKQIGVRDEAKRLDGIGRCGRQYCSASWLPELRPVSLGVAKDQRLSLNPTQISGACGRLMCSLRYEHEYYVQARKRFPKEGKVLRTKVGDEKVVSNDIFRERVVLRSAEGEPRTIPLAQLWEETGGPPAGIAVTAPAPVADDEPEGTAIEFSADSDAIVESDEDSEVPPPAPRQPDGRTTAATPETQQQRPQPPDAERKHRRRGRRGGRRNRRRGGGGSGDGGNSGAPGANGQPHPPDAPSA